MKSIRHHHAFAWVAQQQYTQHCKRHVLQQKLWAAFGCCWLWKKKCCKCQSDSSGKQLLRVEYCMFCEKPKLELLEILKDDKTRNNTLNHNENKLQTQEKKGCWIFETKEQATDSGNHLPLSCCWSADQFAVCTFALMSYTDACKCRAAH